MVQRFANFIGRFSHALSDGTLTNATEETIRTWINEMLGIFGWDVQNTNQILQERTLDRTQRDKLHAIGSTNSRPDYTLVNGNIPLAFIDAKSLATSIRTDSSVAFQIRSYGWSIGAPFSIATNMRELAVYDCKPKPAITDPAPFARILYLQHGDYTENLDKLRQWLDRATVISANYQTDYNSTSVDTEFTNLLSDFRVRLIEDIVASNPGITPRGEQLTLWAQIIINRILFIRVCEARGLEKDGLLKDYTSEGFWGKFKASSYFEFYDRYDGPIFGRNPTLDNLAITDSTFAPLLSALYYPSPYRFDVIPLKTLSDIYDKFLGYAVAVGENGKVTLSVKEEYRKSNGAVTTPLPIVCKTIDNALERAHLETESTEDLLEQSFVDPACGSGAFLASLFDTLSSIIIDKISRGDRVSNDLYVCHNGQYFLTIACRKRIIQQCIFGVDIDQEAVEVARMSLSLKVVDGYEPSIFEEAGVLGHQILSGIGANIKCGNSLVSQDILSFDHNIFDKPEEVQRMRIFDWSSAFPAVFARGGFDYVVGNPPYVEVKHYNSTLGTMSAWIKASYKCSQKGKTDLSIPFIEKGLELLKRGGSLSYVVQKRFFKTDYGFALRRLIREHGLLHSIFEYGDNGLFAGKITYVAIITLRKHTQTATTFLYANSTNPTPTRLPASLMNDQGWSFDNIPVLKLRDALRKRIGVTKDSFKIQVGIQVLWVKSYHIKARLVRDGLIHGSSSLDPDVTIEQDACRELICNEQINPYRLAPTKTYAIFPYDILGNKASPIQFSEYARRFPLAAEYLTRHKSAITAAVETQPSRNPKLDENEYWHLYTRSQNLDTEGQKVIIPMTTYFPMASLVKGAKIYCDNVNINFIQLPQIDDAAYALAGIVNSKIFGTLARNIANPSSGNYSKYNKEFLSQVPFPNHIFTKGRHMLTDISLLSKQIERFCQLSGSATPSEKVSLSRALKVLWNRLDEAVAAAYGLTPDEKNTLLSQPYYER